MQETEKPTLEEFIAALPECPDCGEKLHRFAYCPGRSQIRPETMQHHSTKPEKRSRTMSAIVTKQGKPSKPGEVVDTSKAKVVPPSSEVKTEAAAREVAVQKKATQGKIDGLAKKMTGAKPKGKGSTKPRGTGNSSGPAVRLTHEWVSVKKKDVQVKDKVKLEDGTTVTVVGRWTKHTKAGNVPFITGTTADGTRKNSAASEVTHTK